MHPGAEAWSIRQSDGGEREGLWEEEGPEREDRMWHYSRITTDTLYSSPGLLRVLHCTAAPSVTVMPVDRGLLERWRIRLRPGPSTNESRAGSIT